MNQIGSIEGDLVAVRISSQAYKAGTAEMSRMSREREAERSPKKRLNGALIPLRHAGQANIFEQPNAYPTELNICLISINEIAEAGHRVIPEAISCVHEKVVLIARYPWITEWHLTSFDHAASDDVL